MSDWKELIKAALGAVVAMGTIYALIWIAYLVAPDQAMGLP